MQQGEAPTLITKIQICSSKPITNFSVNFWWSSFPHPKSSQTCQPTCCQSCPGVRPYEWPNQPIDEDDMHVIIIHDNFWNMWKIYTWSKRLGSFPKWHGSWNKHLQTMHESRFWKLITKTRPGAASGYDIPACHWEALGMESMLPAAALRIPQIVPESPQNGWNFQPISKCNTKGWWDDLVKIPERSIFFIERVA